MVNERQVSIDAFERDFPDEASCHLHVARARFGDALDCPCCKAGPGLRPTGKLRQLFCAQCHRYVSPTAGTIFSHSRIDLRDWFYFLLLLSNNPAGLSVSFVTRHFGISRLAAFRILHLARLQMAALTHPGKLGGHGKVVQIDETWLPNVRETQARNARGAIIFGLYDQAGVITKVVPDRKAATLVPIIEELVRPGSIIVTDQHRAYASLAQRGFTHKMLNHTRAEWKSAEGYSMVGIESYWGNLKYFFRSANRNPKGAYLDGYLSEHAFRYNVRKRGGSVFGTLIQRFPLIDKTLLPPGANSRNGRVSTLRLAPAEGISRINQDPLA